jgi:hypothetical protein
VSAVFTQTKGDLKAVVRAILLDPEARAGDNPSKAVPRVGKIKEPILSHTMALRAMGCRSAIADRNDPSRPLWGGQEPYAAPSVFGYFAPNHKTPESLKPAPEEKLLNGNEFNNRAGNISWQLEGNVNGFRSAGCQLDPIEAAARQSDEALITLISQRYFRGAMPQPLRLTMQTLLRDRLGSEEPLRKFGDLVGLALVSPYFGAVK